MNRTRAYRTNSADTSCHETLTESAVVSSISPLGSDDSEKRRYKKESSVAHLLSLLLFSDSLSLSPPLFCYLMGIVRCLGIFFRCAINK